MSNRIATTAVRRGFWKVTHCVRVCTLSSYTSTEDLLRRKKHSIYYSVQSTICAPYVSDTLRLTSPSEYSISCSVEFPISRTSEFRPF